VKRNDVLCKIEAQQLMYHAHNISGESQAPLMSCDYFPSWTVTQDLDWGKKWSNQSKIYRQNWTGVAKNSPAAYFQ